MTLQKHAAAYSLIAFMTADQLAMQASMVQPDSAFASLGADSLDEVELCMAIKDEFGMEIPDVDAEKIKTPADVVAWLEANNFNFDSLPAKAEQTASAESTAAPATEADKGVYGAIAEGYFNDTQPAAPTLQELFDRVVTALIRQGRPSLNDSACAYRGDDGAKCAVGHLISDEVYRSHAVAFVPEQLAMPGDVNRLEEKLVAHELVRAALAQSLGAKLDQRAVDMLGWLQVAHDDSMHGGQASDRDKRQWMRRFEDAAMTVGRIYGLNLTAFHAARDERAAKGTV